MNRKIIQIIVSNGSGVSRDDGLYALCDDGSVWRVRVTYSGVGEWVRLPDLPEQ